MSAKLSINETLDQAGYAVRPRLGDRMRALTAKLDRFSHDLAEGRA